MENLVIRKATKEDLSVLLNFEQGIITAERPWDETLKPDPISYYDISAMIDSQTTDVIVAEIDNELVGSAYIDIREGKPYLRHHHYGYLGFMYVLPEYRGQGVNGKIMDELVHIAKQKNITELRLDVYSDNDSALRAYEKAGFKKHLINMRIGL